VTRFSAHFDTTPDYTLQFTITHTHTHTLVSSLPLRGSGFQCGGSPYSGFPNWPPASAASFSQQQPTTTEASQFSNCYRKSKVSVKAILRPTFSRLVCLGVKPHLGPKTRLLLLSYSCGFLDVGLSFTIATGSRQRSHIYHL
jgi:hypothetical protein